MREIAADNADIDMSTMVESEIIRIEAEFDIIVLVAAATATLDQYGD